MRYEAGSWIFAADADFEHLLFSSIAVAFSKSRRLHCSFALNLGKVSMLWLTPVPRYTCRSSFDYLMETHTIKSWNCLYGIDSTQSPFVEFLLSRQSGLIRILGTREFFGKRGNRWHVL